MDACCCNTGSYFPGLPGVQKLVFCLKIESSYDQNDTVVIMRGSDTLSEALPIICIHLREVRKHSSSNMDSCFYNTASYFVDWSGTQNWLFCLKIESVFGRKGTVTITRGSHKLSEALPIILIHLMEVGKHSSSNGYMSLRYSVLFPMTMMIWDPKLIILPQNWECLW